MAIVVTGTGTAIPANKISNDELSKLVETSDEWIRSHTGIGTRHFAADGQETSDLAVQAARAAMEKAGVTAMDIDVIVLATVTPDYLGFPSTACIVQDKLGAENAAALDINAGCTGFVYGLDVAASMLGSAPDRKRALVIGAETLSRIIDWNDRGTCVLFGDGAAAFVIEKSETVDGRGILTTWLRAKGSGAGSLYLSQPKRDSTYNRPEWKAPPSIIMDGKGVYMFAVKAMTDSIEAIIERTGRPLEDFRWIVPHQANARIVQAAAKRFGIPDDKIYMNIEEFANTSAASIPIAIADLDAKGLLSKGDLIMSMGFGAGLTYGGVAIRW